MISQEYRVNRSQFSRAELAKHEAAWVAFSADGCRIIASANTIERLEEEIAAVGEHPQRVVMEWVAGPDDDSILGGGDLF